MLHLCSLVYIFYTLALITRTTLQAVESPYAFLIGCHYLALTKNLYPLALPFPGGRYMPIHLIGGPNKVKERFWRQKITENKPLRSPVLLMLGLHQCLLYVARYFTTRYVFLFEQNGKRKWWPSSRGGKFMISQLISHERKTTKFKYVAA